MVYFFIWGTFYAPVTARQVQYQMDYNFLWNQEFLCFIVEYVVVKVWQSVILPLRYLSLPQLQQGRFVIKWITTSYKTKNFMFYYKDIRRGQSVV